MKQIGGTAVLCAAFLVRVAIAQSLVVAVPEFDHAGVAGSYVVTLPADYSDAKPWPVIVDFHGAIAPDRRGAEVTAERLFGQHVVQAIVIGLNGRTRSWGTIKGEHDDVAFAQHVLLEVKAKYAVDASRVYLSGFSSGSDFLCRGVLQRSGGFAASLVTCPGPPNVVGLNDDALWSVQKHPFLFVAGEEDYIRKDGAWQAFVSMDTRGARTMYREVPGVGHAFFPADEYARLFAYLELLAGPAAAIDDYAIGKDAWSRGDALLASTHLLRSSNKEARALLLLTEAAGAALLSEAEAIDVVAEPARAYEAFWRVRTQFHRFATLGKRSADALDAQMSGDRRALMKARGSYFETRPKLPPPEKSKSIAELWTFDRYLDDVEVERHLKDLQSRFPERVRLLKIGKSIEGRDLTVVEISDRSTSDASERPAVFVEGGLHGNEISTVTTVLYFAHQCAANPGHKRGIDRLTKGTTFYFLPAANPDALHHHLNEPFSHWRPRYNYRPNDADGDGRFDEDGSEDLDGDGEIGLMYRADEAGVYVQKDGRLVRGTGQPAYALIGREGLDDDGDGKFGEDPIGGVDLNRNFPIGFKSRSSFEGDSGTAALSEPESAAIASFVREHPSIGLFLDYHNDANCVFYWHDAEDTLDAAEFAGISKRAETALGYAPRPLTHDGAGLAIAFAYGERGIPALIVELEAARGEREQYLTEAYGGALLTPKPFVHPQLGEILIGNEIQKLAKRNPHPRDIVWQAERNWTFARAEMARLPRLSLRDVRIEPGASFIAVSGTVVNGGEMPTDSERSVRTGTAVPVRVDAEGARVVGERSLGTLGAGASASFTVRLEPTADAITLLVHQPRAGSVRYRIARPRLATVPIRREYTVESGYATPDTALRADNEFFVRGVSEIERGPAFALKHSGSKLRLAVLLGEWQDRRHDHDAADFARALFSAGEYQGSSPTGQQVYGSLADCYREMSYGQVEVTGEVFGWFELPGSYAEYRDASFGSRIVSDRLLEALFAERGKHALDDFDGIALVWAGNTHQRTSALWPMRVTLPQLPDLIAFKTGELHQGEFMPIGVPCHELAHTYGVNDKYGLGATTNPLGPFCLIARGTHGAEPSGRHRPFPLCAWCRMVIGWTKPVVIDPTTPQSLALRPTLFAPTEAFRVLLKPDGSEYLLLENRRREGFCTDLPSAGLFVLKVGPNDKPDAPQRRVELLPAHGLPSRAGDPVHLEAVAWPSGSHDALTVDGVRLEKIRLVDDVVYFDVKAVGG